MMIQEYLPKFDWEVARSLRDVLFRFRCRTLIGHFKAQRN